MKLIFGPMATISHAAFRCLIEQFGGCDEYFTEMINAGSLLNNGPYEKYYIDPAPVPEKIVWQLTGKDAGTMEKAAEKLICLPGIGIDINMGCSAPDIYKTGAGIGWMLRPEQETLEMINRVGSVISNHNQLTGENKRLSVKLRLGNDDFKEENFYSFCEKLTDSGVTLLTLHPRTKKEKLARIPRYEYCQKLAEEMHRKNVQVYLNGNVKDKNSFDNALIKAPSVDGVMISRAAVSNPWIFAKLKSDENEKKIQIDMKELAVKYIEYIEKYQPEEFWKTRLQRFFSYYADNFLFSHYAKTEFLNAKNNEDLRNRINCFFEKCPEEQIKKF